MTERKLTLSFTAEAQMREWLLRQAAQLTIKNNKKVTMGEVINAALLEHKKKIDKK